MFYAKCENTDKRNSNSKAGEGTSDIIVQQLWIHKHALGMKGKRKLRQKHSLPSRSLQIVCEQKYFTQQLSCND